jgi:hypothetical protein
MNLKIQLFLIKRPRAKVANEKHKNMKENNTTKQQRLTNEKHKNMKENNTTKQQRLTNVKKAKPHKNMILIRNTRENLSYNNLYSQTPPCTTLKLAHKQ